MSHACSCDTLAPAEHDIETYGTQDGAYIRGLFLEGARWDSEQGSLNDSRPKQLYTPLPVIHLDPEQHRKNPDKGVYRCPVYKVRCRTVGMGYEEDTADALRFAFMHFVMFGAYEVQIGGFCRK